MIEGFERLGVSVKHVWGMTETSPCGTSPQPSRTTRRSCQPTSISFGAKDLAGPAALMAGVDVKVGGRGRATSCRATASRAGRRTGARPLGDQRLLP